MPRSDSNKNNRKNNYIGELQLGAGQAAIYFDDADLTPEFLRELARDWLMADKFFRATPMLD